MKNKKGFTLVELLAVIVILALIMSIAVFSITGVLDTAKTKTFKETAASIIDGVKKQLLIEGELLPGDYIFTASILEKGGQESPFGGNITFVSGTLSTTSGGNCENGKIIKNNICRVKNAFSSCNAGISPSYVRIADDNSASICLTAGATNKYIRIAEGTEARLLNPSDTEMIKDASAS